MYKYKKTKSAEYIFIFAANFIMLKVFYFVIITSILGSCIPVKELKYLQKTGELEMDSLGYIVEQETEYHIQRDDVLVMNVTSRDPAIAQFFGVENTSLINAVNEGLFYISGLSVDDEGYIEIPSLGKFLVLGKTIDEVTEMVQSSVYSIYQKDAVFVRMKLTGINYTILGEVNIPGQFIVYRNRLDIIEAIARSGDLNVFAERGSVRLLRKYPEGRKIFELDLTQDKIMNSEFFYLQPNDIILVNPKKQKTIGTGTNFIGTVGALAGTLGSMVAIYSIIDRFTN